MDRRSWLWKRRSSEKSPCETESSGSFSSERLSDEQGWSSNHNPQSPEVASKAAPHDGQACEDVKALTDKLKAALLDINAKEDLVKQHAKVAEEAVTGWEKAENEASTLKLQLDAVGKKNSALEDRVSHLDGALKECMRQLRQAREEQDQRIGEAIAKQSREWESKRSESDSRIAELCGQLEIAKAEACFVDSDLRPKLEAAQKETAALRRELLSLTEELKVKTLERDLSTQTAETASKQHLESIKKMSKLEAECRRLKYSASKASPVNRPKNFASLASFAESTVDSQSDYDNRIRTLQIDAHRINNSELNEYEASHADSNTSAEEFRRESIHRKKPVPHSSEINMMDDFLEMERLVALPKVKAEENDLKVELEALFNRTADLEHKLEKMEAEKLELYQAFTDCEGHLEASQERLRVMEGRSLELQAQLRECQDQLKTSQAQLNDANTRIIELHTQLGSTNELKQILQGELETTAVKREQAESQLRTLEAEVTTLLRKVDILVTDSEKERALSAEATAKCQKLEHELSRLKHEAVKERALSAEVTDKCQKLEHELSSVKREAVTQRATLEKQEAKIQQEKERAIAADKLADCQKTIASLGRQLKTLASFDDFIMEPQKPLDHISRETPKSFESGSILTNLPLVNC